MLCIYHSRDLDGWCSGAIAKLKWPDCKLLGYDYGQPTDALFSAASGEEVIMVDVSLKMPEMQKLAQVAESFTWIDHHISAIKEYRASGLNFKSVLDSDFSACENMWTYVMGTSMPKAVRLLGEYDTWRYKGKDNEEEVLEFQYGMRNICNSPETFPQSLLKLGWVDGDAVDIAQIRNFGRTILRYQALVNESAGKRAFEANVAGYRAICLNTIIFNSDAFSGIYDQEKHDIMVPFQYDGKQKKWIISFYSDKENINCTEIAKQFGGGGHRGASGAQINEIDFLINQQ